MTDLLVPPKDRKAERALAGAEARRIEGEASVQNKALADQLALEQRQREDAYRLEQQRLARAEREQQRREKTAVRTARARERRKAREAAWVRVARVLRMDTVGFWLVALSVMSVAWVGQIAFTYEEMKWPWVAALAGAAAVEGLYLVVESWHTQIREARPLESRGLLFYAAKAVFAGMAAGINYWHQLPKPVPGGEQDWSPTQLAIAYGAMSLIGPILFELRARFRRYLLLIEDNLLPVPMPSFGWRRWIAFLGTSLEAWLLAVADSGMRDGDRAWRTAYRRRRDERRAAAVRTVPWVARVQETKTGLVLIAQPSSSWLARRSYTAPVSVLTWANGALVLPGVQDGRPGRAPVRPAAAAGSVGTVKNDRPGREQDGERTNPRTTVPNQRDENQDERGRDAGTTGTNPRTEQQDGGTGPGTDLDPTEVEKYHAADVEHFQSTGRWLTRDELKTLMQAGSGPASQMLAAIKPKRLRSVG